MATTSELITQLYVGYYNRAPDPEGLNYWVGRYAAGMSIVEIAESFAVQTESTDNYVYLKYPNIADSSSFITTIYNNLFGRAPDTEGLAYWKNELDTDSVSAAKMIVAIINGAQGDDATMVANKVEVGIYYAEEFLTKTWASADNLAGATSVLAGVTADTATVTTGKAAADTEVAAADDSATVGLELSLTTAGDNLEGGANNDTISGGVGTLGSNDDVDGKAGTDTLDVRLDTAAAPVISNVEVLNITMRGSAADLDFADITGYSAINVDGNTDGSLSNLANGDTVTLTNGYAKILSANVASATDTANSLTIQGNGVGSAAFISSGIETINIANLGTATWAIATALAIETANTVNFSGAGGITVNLQSAANGGNVTAVNAAGLSGNLTLGLLDAAATSNVTVVGGAGDDTFAFGTGLNTLDSIDGGAGTDTVTMTLETALRSANSAAAGLSMSNVETMSVIFGTAQTVHGSAIDDSLATLNLRYTTAATFTAMGNSVQTVNVQSADGAFAFTYASGQTGTDVVLNLGLTTAAETATTAAHGLSAGAITIAGNSGAMTINSIGQSANAVGLVTVNSVNSLTIDATTQSLSLTGLTALAANAAKSVTINAVGKAFSAAGDASFTAATSVALSVSGGTAADFVMGDIAATKADTLSLNVDGASAGMTIGTATVGGALDTVNIGASGGNVTVGQLIATTATNSGAMSVGVNISAATATTVTITDVQWNTAGTGAIAASFTLTGGGTIALAGGPANTAGTANADHSVSIDASGFAGTLSANFGGVAYSAADFTATFGTGLGTVWLGAGNDTLNAGGSAQVMIGGMGDNTYNMSSAAQTVVLMAGANTASALSATTAFETATINDAGSGDIIVFAAVVATASTFYGRGESTAGIAAVVYTAGLDAGFTAAGGFGTIAYTVNGGDTLVHVQVSTAAPTTATVYTVTLKDFLPQASGSFSVSTAGTAGLALVIA